MKTTAPSKSRSDVWVNLGTFDHLTDATVFSAALQSAGLEARILDERKLQKRWFAAKPQAGVHVAVHEDELETARDAVKTNPRVLAAFQKAITCPECHSSRIQYPQMTRKNMLPTLLAKALVALGAMEHECYCEDCHFTWPRNGKRPGRTTSRPATT